jgi:alcohol dehydrogenase (cytochrome c)
MTLRTRLLTATIAATALGFGTTAYAQEAFAPTTPERLLNADAEPHNWLLYNGNYSNWHYSQLDQINTGNVANLRVAYMFAIGGCSQAPASGTPNCNTAQVPLVENGILYVTDQYSRVTALDVRSGDAAIMLWRFDPQSTRATDRGIALYENTIIQTTGDARIIALDKRSGEVLWEVGAQEVVDQPNPADVIAARTLPGAEQVYPTAGGQQILTVGPSGPGVGWMAAYDANNGELIWRTHTIPQPGEPDFGTWPGETWRWGAAMPWGAPPAYDPETNLLIFGTGEPSPVYDPEFRPGDNLYSVSTLAMDADTGQLMWWFQEVPNDQWDYDSTASRILYDVTVDGETIGVTGNWARNGFYYVLNRVTGEFVQAVPQLDNINWTAGIDEKTGLPIEYNAEGGLQTYAVAGPRRGRSEADAPLVCATWGGGTTGIWQASFDPTTGITYNTRTTGCTYQTVIRPTDEAFNPLQREGLGGQVQLVQVDTQWALVAIDTATGEVVNTAIRDQGIPGNRQAQFGAMATAGGLVFTAGDDGRVSAFDKDTLEELWHFNVGVKMKGSFISFAVDGTQYIAAVTGGGFGGGPAVPAAGSTLVVWSLPQ